MLLNGLFRKSLSSVLLCVLLSLSLSVNAVTESEWNNNCSDADSGANPGTSNSGNLSNSGDQDWFKGYLNKEKDNACQSYNKEVLK